MGVFTKRVLFANWNRSAVAEADAIIDTGSHYCVVPESLAQLLGLQIVGTDKIALADGREIEAPVAGLRIEFGGESGLFYHTYPS